MYIQSKRQFETLRFLWFIHESCRMYSGSVMSGCRSEEHNKNVGGNPRSKHMFKYGWGLATDIWFDTPEARNKVIISARLEGYYPYVGDDYKENRLHIQAFPIGYIVEEIDDARTTEV